MADRVKGEIADGVAHVMLCRPGKKNALDPVRNSVFDRSAAIKPFFTMLARDTYLSRGFGHRTAEGSGVTLWVPPGQSTVGGTWTGVSINSTGVPPWRSDVVAARTGRGQTESWIRDRR